MSSENPWLKLGSKRKAEDRRARDSSGPGRGGAGQRHRRQPRRLTRGWGLDDRPRGSGTAERREAARARSKRRTSRRADRPEADRAPARIRTSRSAAGRSAARATSRPTCAVGSAGASRRQPRSAKVRGARSLMRERQRRDGRREAGAQGRVVPSAERRERAAVPGRSFRRLKVEPHQATSDTLSVAVPVPGRGGPGQRRAR